MSVVEQLEKVLAGANHQIIPMLRPGIQAYAQNVDGRPALLLRVDNDFSRAVDGTNGINVHVDSAGMANRFLRFESESQGLTPMFAAIVSSLLDDVAESDPVGGLIDRYEELCVMFARRTGRLSESAVRGLFAELVMLLELKESGSNAASAIHAWQGPYRVAKDFVLPHGRAVEVKSIRRENRRVRISSVEQLDARGEDLRLAVLPLETSSGDEGTGLLDLLSEVGAWVDAEPAARLPYAQALSTLGLDLEDPYYRRWSFVMGEWRWYAVGSGFPRVDVADVPPAVSRVTFSLDTDQLSGYISTPFWSGDVSDV